MRALLLLIVPLWTPPASSSNATFRRLFALQPRVLGSHTAGPAYLYFELDRAADPLLQRLPRTVLPSLRIWPKPPAQRHILVVQRSRTRRLGGKQSGTLTEIKDALCRLGLEVRATAPRW